MAASPVIRADSSRDFTGCSSISQYEVLQKLGEGTFGEVHMAKSRRTGAVVALKKILMHNEKDGFPVTAIREIKLLKLLKHVNVLTLEEMAIERPQGPGRQKAILYMVTPYMDHDLAGLLENPEVEFGEGQIKCYLKQLLQGLQYIHDNHILHRDMKAANLLINNRGILQIADFGLARHYDEPVPQPKQGGGEARRDYTTLVVTRWYRPPELLLQNRRYTTAIDMWGVGCVFGEMFKRTPILTGKSDLDQIQIIFDMVGSPNDQNMPGWHELPGCEGIKTFEPRPGNLREQFPQLNTQGFSLLRDLLKLDWRKRITAIDALSHQYFTVYPPPLKPHEVPTYAASHELDRRKERRDKKAAPPPAPAGGTVGMGPNNGEWAGPSAPHSNAAYNSDPPSRDYRSGPGEGRSQGPPTYDRGPPGTGHYSNGYSSRPPTGQGPPPQRAPGMAPQPRYGNDLPPRPPPVAYSSQPHSRGPPTRDHPPRDMPPREPPPRDGGRNAKDTYIPSYQQDDRRPPQRDDRDRDRNYDRRDHRDYDAPSDKRGTYGRERDRRSMEYDDRRPPARDGRGGYDDRDHRDRRGGRDRDALRYDDGDRGYERRATRSRSPARRERDYGR